MTIMMMAMAMVMVMMMTAIFVTVLRRSPLCSTWGTLLKAFNNVC